jgi:hypothetical protein
VRRSPLAYPLNRSADTDGGGAADLQTDIMRFMAILSLCLVAIFALVQSIPLTPAEPVAPTPQTAVVASADPAPVVEQARPAELPDPPPPAKANKPAEKTVTLTRPKWVPKYQPQEAVVTPPIASPEVRAAVPDVPDAPPQAMPPVESKEEQGFTLRFESDAALTRLVAASQVGLYAIDHNRAQRMTVSESRISFWDASTPNTFHEMETGTVPVAVIEALSRTGTQADAVSWGVTLPGRLKSQLDTLMNEHRGGSLIIGAGGDIRWEAS